MVGLQNYGGNSYIADISRTMLDLLESRYAVNLEINLIFIQFPGKRVLFEKKLKLENQEIKEIQKFPAIKRFIVNYSDTFYQRKL